MSEQHHDHLVIEKSGSNSSWAAVAAVFAAIVLGLVLWITLAGDGISADEGGDVTVPPVPTTLGEGG